MLEFIKQIDVGFFTQLVVVFSVLISLITVILTLNKDKFKIRVDDEALKRKEASVLIKELYDELKGDVKQMKLDHAEEIKNMKAAHTEEITTIKREHAEEMTRRDERNAEEIRKRDVIIAELISRLPTEARQVVEAKMQELDLQIKV